MSLRCLEANMDWMTSFTPSAAIHNSRKSSSLFTTSPVHWSAWSKVYWNPFNGKKSKWWRKTRIEQSCAATRHEHGHKSWPLCRLVPRALKTPRVCLDLCGLTYACVFEIYVESSLSSYCYPLWNIELFGIAVWTAMLFSFFKIGSLFTYFDQTPLNRLQAIRFLTRLITCITRCLQQASELMWPVVAGPRLWLWLKSKTLSSADWKVSRKWSFIDLLLGFRQKVEHSRVGHGQGQTLRQDFGVCSTFDNSHLIQTKSLDTFWATLNTNWAHCTAL